MSDEHSLWDALRLQLSPFMKLVRIEDKYQRGIPDVIYIIKGGHVGWLELKHVDHWPKVIFTIESLQLEQVTFLDEWTEWNGRANLLLRVNHDYLLIPPYHSRKILNGHYKSSDVKASAIVYSRGKLDVNLFVKELKKLALL